jgi:ribosomal protein S18 acetylase RimI-like enzyme
MIGTPSQYSPSKLVGLKSPESLEKGEYFMNIKENNTIVGSLWVKKYNNTYIFRDIFVLPDYRRQGIASQMITAMLKHLKPKKLPIFLYVDSDNKAAISAYVKLGFEKVKKGAYGDKYEYKE